MANGKFLKSRNAVSLKFCEHFDAQKLLLESALVAAEDFRGLAVDTRSGKLPILNFLKIHFTLLSQWKSKWVKESSKKNLLESDKKARTGDRGTSDWR
ncbi:hypothetical protein [Treponema socranskii]|uniref:hypothetical protein n=1 Tax=Treponema socranskii TaxID=53419 RepID=UPI003D8F8548